MRNLAEYAAINNFKHERIKNMAEYKIQNF